MQLVEKRRKRIDKFIQKLKNDIDEVYEFLWRFWVIDRLLQVQGIYVNKEFSFRSSEGSSWESDTLLGN